MISKDTVRFLSRPGRRYVLATRRSELKRFAACLDGGGWQRLAEHPEVEVKPVRRGRVFYLLARSRPRRKKERAIRRRQRRGLKRRLHKLQQTIARGRLKKRDTILERLGRLKERYPKGDPVRLLRRPPRSAAATAIHLERRQIPRGPGSRQRYLLRSNQSSWSAAEFWETYMQLTVVERALPGAEKRIAVASHLASLQRPHRGPRVHLRAGLCPVENAGSPGQASGADDRDSQARSAPGPTPRRGRGP